MRILLDNTGLHAVGRCLRRAATSPTDTAGLLQLGSALIFADEILVGGSEGAAIGEGTTRVLADLGKFGFGPSVVRCRVETSSEWTNRCLTAADELLNDVDDLVPPGSVTDGIAPTGRAMMADGQRLHELVQRERSLAELKELSSQARERPGDGLVEYIISVVPDLFYKLRSVSAQWGDQSVEAWSAVAATIRVFVNSRFAGEAGAEYVPAVGRAKLLRRGEATLIEQMEELVRDMADRLRPRSLELPRIGSALLHKCNGTPEGVLAESMRLRNLAEPLRDVLRGLRDKYLSDDPAQVAEATEVVRHIGDSLAGELALREGAKLRDAVELSFVLGVPTLSVSGKSLVDWVERRWWRRRIVALSEMSKSLAFARGIDAQYKRLSRACEYH